MENFFNKFPNVFLDLDGVLADFVKHLLESFNVQNITKLEESPGVLRQDIKNSLSEGDFFYRLNKFPTTDALINLVSDFSDNKYSILSKPFKNNVDNCIFQKKRWVKKHIKINPPKEVIITDKKHMYAKEIINNKPIANLLIDNYPQSCERFIQAGGVAILYDPYKHTLKYLEKKLKEAYQ